VIHHFSFCRAPPPAEPAESEWETDTEPPTDTEAEKEVTEVIQVANKSQEENKESQPSGGDAVKEQGQEAAEKESKVGLNLYLNLRNIFRNELFRMLVHCSYSTTWIIY
jgi:hypothetical protein